MPRPFTLEELVAIRRDLHMHPELSGSEMRTAAAVAGQLDALGLSPRSGVGGHGVVAVVEGSRPGPTLLYRADMDALPIEEIAERPYRSCNAGVMHACGHDVHTTIGLGVAAALTSRREDLCGRVKLVFQPAEEAVAPPGQVIGAAAMVGEGVLHAPDVDAAFALHCAPGMDVGTMGGTGGPVWAASDPFDLVIRGRMAHGAYPHDGIDPVLAAAYVVTALQQIIPRNIDAREPVVLSVCRLEAGTAYNIMPEFAHAQGLVRTLDPEVRRLMMSRVREVVEMTCAACGCEATLRWLPGAHLTANDVALEEVAERFLKGHSSAVRWERTRPQMGAEDFSAFSERVPSCFLFLGIRDEATGIVGQLHTPSFDVHERCLEVGVDAMSELLLHVGRTWDSIRPALAAPA